MPCRGGHPFRNMKETVICLLFKRHLLDLATLNNYHTVFNFYFWRRLLKRWWGSIAAPSRKQIFLEPFQPGIRSRHGTKIVLVTRVKELCQDGEGVIYPSYLWNFSTASIPSGDIMRAAGTVLHWHWSFIIRQFQSGDREEEGRLA